MLRSIVTSSVLLVLVSNSVYAQSTRTSATSSSPVSSSRTTASSSRSSGTTGAALGEFQPIDRGGFVGRNQDAGFVGRSATGTGTTGRSGLATGMGMGMGMGMSMGGMGMGGMNSRGTSSQFGQQNSSQNQRTIRATVKVRFPYTRPAASEVSQTVVGRWNRIPLPEKFNGVNLAFVNGVATLTGKVATAEEKRMAEKLILLEPGVSVVQNQLEVIAAATSN